MGGTAVAVAQGLTTGTIAGDATLSLYPNPASSLLHLELSTGASLDNVQVFDARGAAVPSARYQGSGQLDVSGLSGGLYLLRATAGGQTFTQRFTKE